MTQNVNNDSDNEERPPLPSGPDDQRGSGAPEPPSRYNVHPYASNQNPLSSDTPNNVVGQNDPQQADPFKGARGNLKAAMIMAMVSFIIGGVVLSGAALITAIIGYRKAAYAAASNQIDPQSQYAYGMRRMSVAVLVLCVVSLVVNIAFLVYIYPIYMDMIMSGSDSLFGNTSANTPLNSGNSFWG